VNILLDTLSISVPTTFSNMSQEIVKLSGSDFEKELFNARTSFEKNPPSEKKDSYTKPVSSEPVKNESREQISHEIKENENRKNTESRNEEYAETKREFEKPFEKSKEKAKETDPEETVLAVSESVAVSTPDEEKKVSDDTLLSRIEEIKSLLLDEAKKGIFGKEEIKAVLSLLKGSVDLPEDIKKLFEALLSNTSNSSDRKNLQKLLSSMEKILPQEVSEFSRTQLEELLSSISKEIPEEELQNEADGKGVDTKKLDTGKILESEKKTEHTPIKTEIEEPSQIQKKLESVNESGKSETEEIEEKADNKVPETTSHLINQKSSEDASTEKEVSASDKLKKDRTLIQTKPKEDALATNADTKDEVHKEDSKRNPLEKTENAVPERIKQTETSFSSKETLSEDKQIFAVQKAVSEIFQPDKSLTKKGGENGSKTGIGFSQSKFGSFLDKGESSLPGKISERFKEISFNKELLSVKVEKILVKRTTEKTENNLNGIKEVSEKSSRLNSLTEESQSRLKRAEQPVNARDFSKTYAEKASLQRETNIDNLMKSDKKESLSYEVKPQKIDTLMNDHNEKQPLKEPVKTETAEAKIKQAEEKKELSELGKNDSSPKTAISSKVEVKPAVAENNLNDIYLKIREMAKTETAQSKPIETATIRLTPPSLGKVELEIVKDAMKITVFMKVESLEAKEMLEKNSNFLALKLGNSGFDVQKINIQVSKEEDSQNREQNNNNGQNQNGKGSDPEGKQEKEGGSDNLEDFELSFADILRGGSGNVL